MTRDVLKDWPILIALSLAVCWLCGMILLFSILLWDSHTRGDCVYRAKLIGPITYCAVFERDVARHQR